ncbi:ATP synthase F0 subunit B [Streptomyces jumonjinensis]|uniref:Cell division initiation protein n=1 Tax=Streptomyces jumonjinensis TaxID=1945 RepID=A0A646KJJ7_STRJU|nr:cell division initiation protein [Streptomyces jumonjinensis]MQT02187.1 cell division initiation protein [Streptomyces jumonjinensis]
MDVQKKLDEIVQAIGSARSMPMSASCVVNRAELLALLEEVREALPGSLAQAQELIGGREQLVAQARQEAERIIESAHAERGSLISSTQVARRSQDEADRIVADARREAEEIRAEADDYVDSKLANFEVVLTKTIGSVDRGREKLLGRGPGLDRDGYADADAPEYSADPQTLVHRADEYVDAKLGAFEAVLSKTLEAVGRGRQKLQGRTTGDALGEHMAAQDAAGSTRRHASDAEYLAGLAELADPAPQRPREPLPPQPPALPEHRQPQPPAYEPPPSQQSGYEIPQYETPRYETPQYDPAPSQPPAYEPPSPAGGAYEPPAPAGNGARQDPFDGYRPQQAYEQYPQDPYAAYQQQQAYEQYAQQDPYAYQDVPRQQHAEPHDDGPRHPGQPAPAQAAALDETSFFDTSMIDLDELRRYEQGH